MGRKKLSEQERQRRQEQKEQKREQRKRERRAASVLLAVSSAASYVGRYYEEAIRDQEDQRELQSAYRDLCGRYAQLDYLALRKAEEAIRSKCRAGRRPYVRKRTLESLERWAHKLVALVGHGDAT